MDLLCQDDQGVCKKVCRHGWEAPDRKQVIERSQLLVLSRFHEKKDLETPAWELHRNKRSWASDNGLRVLSS